MAQTTTSSTSIPSYVEKPIKSSLGSIEDFLNSDANYVYGSKKGESLFTPLSSSQNKAIGNVNWLADQNLAKMFGISDSEGMWKDFANDRTPLLTGDYSGATIDADRYGDFASLDTGKYGAVPGVSTERLVDETGQLGAIDDYMNPFLDQVLAPQIREINEAIQRQRNDLGASSAMSGAFGDARHGVMESEIYKGANEAVSDTTGQAYSDAFNTAMGMRSGDLNRFLNVDLANMDNANRAIERIMQGDVVNVQSENAGIGRALQGALANMGSINEGTGRQLAADSANQSARQTSTANKAAAAQGLAGLGGQYFDLFSDVNDMLYNAGDVERDAEEGRRQAIEAFQTAVKDKKYNDALKLLAAAQGSPMPASTTSKTESDDGMWGLVGSALGALF